MAIYSGFSHQKWWFSIVMLNYQRDEPPWIRAIGKTPGETLGFSMGIPLTWPSFGCWRPRHRQDHVSQGSGLVHWDTWNFRQNHGDFCHQAIGDLYEMDDHNPYSMSWPWHNGICPWKHCHSLSNTSFLQLAHACAGAASHSPLVKVMKLKPFERWNMSFLSHLLAASMTPDFPLNTHPSADETHSICPNFDFDLITKSPQMMSWWGRSQHDVMIGRILIGSHCRFISSLEGTWIYMTFCDFPLINLSFGKSPGFFGGWKMGFPILPMFRLRAPGTSPSSTAARPRWPPNGAGNRRNCSGPSFRLPPGGAERMRLWVCPLPMACYVDFRWFSIAVVIGWFFDATIRPMNMAPRVPRDACTLWVLVLLKNDFPKPDCIRRR